MRMIVLGAVLALMGSAAGAQMGPGAGYPPPGRSVPQTAPMPPAPMRTAPLRTGGAQQWGSNVGGHWWGGVNAPGGIGAYRQPYRGYRVPGYWASPRFVINDWGYYGLPQPLGGYRWARYYDDAVMIDRGGQVYDYRSGLDWDGRYDDRAYAGRRSSGVGGAVAGAVVGGVAGNVIAGRGDRTAGTLIGAGLGGAAGYAIDRSRVRRGPAPGYDYGYDDRGPPSYDRGGYPGGSSWVSADGRTTVTTSTSGGYGYSSAPVIVSGGGYGYAGGATTVTVQSAPVVTTTTTEVIEDSVAYSRPVVRRVYRARAVRARPRVVHRRPVCGCGS